MKCENELCVYQSGDECILRSISIDSQGMCADCILATLDDETLAAAKAKTLDQLENL